MSGIVAVFSLDGQPLPLEQLADLTQVLRERGPDAEQIWQEELTNSVGFGYTQLVTTWEAAHERQPFCLDPKVGSPVWIVADARIDNRANLATQLGLPALSTHPCADGSGISSGVLDSGVITDVELILRAYLKWGTDCVEQLLGDFAFVIWDGHQQQLFAARDQMGVKPLYYSHLGNLLILSNTLNCIRQHPAVSAHLNETALGDWLLFDFNYNLATTVFSDIQRLPPAHRLICRQTLVVERYWTLPEPELLRYAHTQDYLDHFHQVMAVAVADRLRQRNVAANLSGGLDSTTIAATALRVAQQQQQRLDYQAHTIVYDSLIPDQERHYTTLAAEHLGVPVHWYPADHYALYQNWQGLARLSPEPCVFPLAEMVATMMQAVSQHSRVLLSGNGGDEVFKGASVRQCLGQMPLPDLLWDLWQCLGIYHLRPNWGMGLSTRWQQWRKSPTNRLPSAPHIGDLTYLNPDFATRQNLAERLQAWDAEVAQRQPATLSVRGTAHQRVNTPLYLRGFESKDPGATGFPVEIRYPFLDLRLINFCLALPPIPWCIHKQLLRVAMQNLLPSAILQRPKSPLAGWPDLLKAQAMPPPPTSLFGSLSQQFIDVPALLQSPEINGARAWQTSGGLRAIGIAYWLNQLEQAKI